MKEINLNNSKKSKYFNKGYVAMVDDDDFDLVNQYSWQIKIHGKTVYARGIVKHNGVSKSVYMHRFIKDTWDSGLEVDHIDNNGLNNIKSNLRVCPHLLNSKNRSLNVNKNTKYKGVTVCKGGFYARITIEGKVISLGRFTTEEHAANIYNKAAVKYFGEYANLNILPDWFDKSAADVKNKRAKITYEIAQEIRNYSLPIHELAIKYGINKNTIRDILQGRSWNKPLPEHQKVAL